MKHVVASGLLLMSLLTGCAFPSAVVPTAAPTTQPTELPTPQPNSPTPSALPPTAIATPQGATAVPLASDELERLNTAMPEARDQVALAEAFGRTSGTLEPTPASQPNRQLGDEERFYVTDNVENTSYEITARLRYVGSSVLMYVDTRLDVSDADVANSGKAFDEEIYPRDRALFGHENSPGIDGDPRLTVLNTSLNGGVAGYFSSRDNVPVAVNQFSNEREMFVMGINYVPLGTPAYASTLAHEFQHMIHENVQPRSPSWFNEGMSTLAQDLNGFESDGYPGYFLRNPDTQLTSWSTTGEQLQHYGASQLFLRYVLEHYSGEDGLAALIRDDAGNKPEVFAALAQQKNPDIQHFNDLLADWAVANLLNDASVGDGRYAYRLLPDTITPQSAQNAADVSIAQLAAHYIDLPNGASLSFDGAETVGLTGATPENGRYVWWSNRGDQSVSTLTREIDLRNVSSATLQFSTWYEIERDWDYGYASVSTDGGATWQTLPSDTTTTYDPVGHNYGNALTGVSGSPGVDTDDGTRGQWIEQQMDLSAFAGQQVLLRFWLVQDDAYNASGWLIDNIRIPEISFSDDVEAGDDGWQAVGFVRTTGELPQQWTLRLVRHGASGTSVEAVPVDTEGKAEVTLQDGEKGVLVVLGTTPFTTERASFHYALQR